MIEDGQSAKTSVTLQLQGFHRKAGDKTRTCDRLITNQLLYQLSYTSKSTFKYSGLAMLWTGVLCREAALENGKSLPSGGSGTAFSLNPCDSDETLVKGRPNPPGFHGYR